MAPSEHHRRHHHHHTGAGRTAGTQPASGQQRALNRLAFMATAHCMVGCGLGEILGLVIGVALGLSTIATIALAVALAFVFGYAFTLVPLARSGMGWSAALRTALAADTASIAIMEVVDNGIMLVIPGAMTAGPRVRCSGDRWSPRC